jgi:cellobiose PTS system EIIA component
MENLEQVAFELIAYSGEARSYVIEAMQFAKKGEISKAEEAIKNAKEQIGKTHKIHADLIQQEAQGKKTEFSVLLLHAEDHFMTANTMIEMVDFIVDLYNKKEA